MLRSGFGKRIPLFPTYAGIDVRKLTAVKRTLQPNKLLSNSSAKTYLENITRYRTTRYTKKHNLHNKHAHFQVRVKQASSNIVLFACRAAIVYKSPLKCLASSTPESNTLPHSFVAMSSNKPLIDTPQWLLCKSSFWGQSGWQLWHVQTWKILCGLVYSYFTPCALSLLLEEGYMWPKYNVIVRFHVLKGSVHQSWHSKNLIFHDRQISG